MSWEAYITNLKAADSNGVVAVSEAAIWGMDPVSPWTTSGGLNAITADEMKVLLGNRTNFRSNGPVIAGVKCMLLQDKFDDEGVYSLNLKTKSDAEGNTYPICVGKSLKALVIAKGFKDTAGGALAQKVFGVVEYLRKSNM